MKESTKKRYRNRSKKIRVSEEEGYFDRLPSELIIAIFDKILDVNCLCICSSVSKYFAAHVVQTRFVSVEIGPPRKSPFLVWQPGPQVENFFKKLRCVESATIHYSLCNRNSSKSQRMPLVWWKSDSNGFILVASSNPEFPRWRKFRVDKYRFVFRSIRANLLDFMHLFYFTKERLALLPNLKNISALDPLKQGRIVLDEEDIACMKRENPLEGRGKFCVRQWIAHKVKLPLSGRVMENVVVILSREIGSSDDSVADNLLEENDYREVAATMMKKRADYQSELRLDGIMHGSEIEQYTVRRGRYTYVDDVNGGTYAVLLAIPGILFLHHPQVFFTFNVCLVVNGSVGSLWLEGTFINIPLAWKNPCFN